MFTLEYLEEWAGLKKTLASVKAREMDMRKSIAAFVLGNKKKGVAKTNIENYLVKATGVLNGKIDDAALRVIWPELSAEEKDAVKFKPELKMKQYNALPKNSKLRTAVTFKPGAPGLEITPLEV